MDQMISLVLLGCFTITSAQQAGSAGYKVANYTATMLLTNGEYKIKVNVTGPHKLLAASDVIEVQRGELGFGSKGEAIIETTAASIIKVAGYAVVIRSFQPARGAFTACVVVGAITSGEVSKSAEEDVTCSWTIKQLEPARSVCSPAGVAQKQVDQFVVGTKVRALGRILRISRGRVDIILDRIHSVPEERARKRMRNTGKTSVPLSQMPASAGTVSRNQHHGPPADKTAGGTISTTMHPRTPNTVHTARAQKRPARAPSPRYSSTTSPQPVRAPAPREALSPTETGETTSKSSKIPTSSGKASPALDLGSLGEDSFYADALNHADEEENHPDGIIASEDQDQDPDDGGYRNEDLGDSAAGESSSEDEYPVRKEKNVQSARSQLKRHDAQIGGDKKL